MELQTQTPQQYAAPAPTRARVTIPRDLRHCTGRDLLALGITPTTEGDDLTVEAILPAGWSKVPAPLPTRCWWYLLDEHGRIRAQINQVETRSDRVAYLFLMPRYTSRVSALGYGRVRYVVDDRATGAVAYVAGECSDRNVISVEHLAGRVSTWLRAQGGSEFVWED